LANSVVNALVPCMSMRSGMPQHVG
jgi:hypothetical protein